jgi:ABC-type multidrug transport system fused ATPase/permease subunit
MLSIVFKKFCDCFMQGVDLTLKPGAKVALVGPSGGGKV